MENVPTIRKPLGPSGTFVAGAPLNELQNASPPEAARVERLESIDVLRGLVMAVMVLDHARDYFSASEINPTAIDHGSVSLFLTRWVTHFCAPVFFLLAGTGAYLSGRRKTRPELASFLLTRGAFLVILDLTIVRLGWDFNFQFAGGPMFVVLSALGFSMIALAGLIYLPVKWVAGFGAAMIVLHNLADGLDQANLGAFRPIWDFLHVRGPVEVGGVPFYVSYPLIPWVGVMALGYGIGPLFEQDRFRRRKQLFFAGLGLTLAFFVLRASNLYGDVSPWRYDAGWVSGFLSFLNATKYPPSLLYLLMTLGPSLLVLAALDRAPGPVARSLIPLGRTALFFYVLHLYLLHAMAVLFGTLQGFSARSMCVFYTDLPIGYGFSLPVVYLWWLVAVAVLYGPCLWYANLKKRHRNEAWLSYL